MDKLDKELLAKISDLHDVPQGSFNIRKNGEVLLKNSTDEIQIMPKKNKNGIDIYVKDNVKNKSLFYCKQRFSQTK